MEDSLVSLSMSAVVALMIFIGICSIVAGAKNKRVPGKWYHGGDLPSSPYASQSWVYQYDPDNPNCDKMPQPPKEDE